MAENDLRSLPPPGVQIFEGIEPQMATIRVRYAYAMATSGLVQTTMLNALLGSIEYVDEHILTIPNTGSDSLRHLIRTAEKTDRAHFFSWLARGLDWGWVLNERSAPLCWAAFLGEAMMIEEFLSWHDEEKDPYGVFSFLYGLPPVPLPDLLSITKRLMEAVKNTEDRGRSIREGLETRMHEKFCMNVERFYQAIERDKVTAQILLLEKLCEENGLRFSWYNLTRFMPLEFIFHTRDLPWDSTSLHRHYELNSWEADRLGIIPYNLSIDGGDYSLEWLEKKGLHPVAKPEYLNPSHPVFRAYNPSPHVPDTKFSARPLQGIWRSVLYIRDVIPSRIFTKHGAAGVVQRCWRRHRERLRRKEFARRLDFWRGTFLELPPKDVLWIVYRYIRILPPAVLRGLPPKLR
jgi:hypothetical protein